jgi:hypothetical protein
MLLLESLDKACLESARVVGFVSAAETKLDKERRCSSLSRGRRRSPHATMSGSLPEFLGRGRRIGVVRGPPDGSRETP